MNAAQDANVSAPASNEADRIEVSDVNTLVTLVAGWHGRKVKALKHFLTLPEGQVVQLGEEPEFAVTGDTHKGFLLGLNLALMEFGILPFSFELEDAANDKEADGKLPPGDLTAHPDGAVTVDAG